MKQGNRVKNASRMAAVTAMVTPALAGAPPAIAAKGAPLVQTQAKTKHSINGRKATAAAARKARAAAARRARARAQVRKELRRMSAAQKRRLASGRTNLQSIATAKLAISKCCHTFSHGVGCGGTSKFTQGITCCVIGAGGFQAN